MSLSPSDLFAFWLDLFGFLIAVAILGFGCPWFQAQGRLPEPPSSPSLPTPDLFSAQHITRTFVAALPNLTRELNLEVATTRQVEFFERSDHQRTLWGWLSLGPNVARLRLPPRNKSPK